MKKNCKPRENLEPGSKNVIHESFIDPTKVFLPPLHIKIELMTQFCKSSKQRREIFQIYLRKVCTLKCWETERGNSHRTTNQTIDEGCGI